MLIYLQTIYSQEDKDLFIYIYEHHKKQMVWVANKILQNKENAEDAVHNAFVGIANNIASLKNRSEIDIKNYALKSAQNAARNIQSKENLQRKYDVEALKEYEIDLALEKICLRETYDTIVSAIRNLDEPYGFVLYCLYVMEMDVKEIAVALSRNPAAVRQQIVRGKKKLLDLLRKEEEFEYI